MSSTEFEFDVSGTWTARQSNGFVATFNLIQEQPRNPEGQIIPGSPPALRGSGAADSLQGLVERGEVLENSFFLILSWGDGSSRSEYSGTFNLDGRIHGGVTFYLEDSEERADWFSERTFDRTFLRVLTA
jgi:hypothetical protein